ncbi:MAG TPA: hypothetical protein VK475_06600 [Pyrinomonadaceae bacterium]|nr:hypothetical protein [Pyrinomonadaceae bacterium]
MKVSTGSGRPRGGGSDRVFVLGNTSVVLVEHPVATAPGTFLVITVGLVRCSSIALISHR